MHQLLRKGSETKNTHDIFKSLEINISSRNRENVVCGGVVGGRHRGWMHWLYLALPRAKPLNDIGFARLIGSSLCWISLQDQPEQASHPYTWLQLWFTCRIWPTQTEPGKASYHTFYKWLFCPKRTAALVNAAKTLFQDFVYPMEVHCSKPPRAHKNTECVCIFWYIITALSKEDQRERRNGAKPEILCSEL